MRRLLIVCLCLLKISLHAQADSFSHPWFTGPLITPSGHVVPLGYVNVEPYTFVTFTNGQYDADWKGRSVPTLTQTIWQLPIWFGITPKMDLEFIIQSSWNSRQGKTNMTFGDFLASIEYQLLLDTTENRVPGIKLYLQQTFPTGPWQRLAAEDMGTDAGGDGMFTTELGAVLSRTFRVYRDHFLALRLNPAYNFRYFRDVRGISVFGGSPKTNGKIRQGDEYELYFGAEYNLTRNWALALDLTGFYQYKSKFKGKMGIFPVGLPESIQFTAAPAIEYNFSSKLGLIGGAWLTVGGKNTPRFVSGVIALNYFGPLSAEKPHLPQLRTGGGGGGR